MKWFFNSKTTKTNNFYSKPFKNAQSYCQPTKELMCNILPIHTHPEDLFRHPQTLKLASGTHTEWILNRDKKHNQKYQKLAKNLKATNLKNETFALIPNFLI